MKSGEPNTAKEVYKQLRGWSCRDLWEETGRFDKAPDRERFERVGLVRAVGVVFSESGTEQEKEAVRGWLTRLLSDPQEKIRRYAMAALPKIGSGPSEEKALLSLLGQSSGERENQFLGRALDKIGGSETLKMMGGKLLARTEQRVRANIARSQSPSAIRMDGILSKFTGLRIHLRCRKGLEGIVRDEVQDSVWNKERFRTEKISGGLVVITPVASFSLSDVYKFRCFDSVGIVLGSIRGWSQVDAMEEIARTVSSASSKQVLQSFTKGAIRYRLSFLDPGAPQDAVRLVADRVFAYCPEILNDARSAPWAIDIYRIAEGGLVELRPRLTPDPRLFYRQRDVPAASHPPLAACMARLGGKLTDEIVWDPFCGSGLELIERALLGGVKRLFGTDRSEEAVEIARKNFSAAGVRTIASNFTCCDFRDYAIVPGLGAESVTLIVTNPPMGKRVPIPNLNGLIQDLFSVANRALKPGGKLIFANPLLLDSPYPSLKLQSRRVVDFGGFNCRLEVYLKTAK